jgi:DNA-binding transcriptional LysR family regulator
MGRREPSWDELRTFRGVGDHRKRGAALDFRRLSRKASGRGDRARRHQSQRRPRDSDTAQLAALRAGVGIGGCQEGVARRSNDLVPVLPGAFQMTLEIWLIMHRDRKSTPRVRLMFDWLAEGLSDYVKGRSGRLRSDTRRLVQT